MPTAMKNVLKYITLIILTCAILTFLWISFTISDQKESSRPIADSYNSSNHQFSNTSIAEMCKSYGWPVRQVPGKVYDLFFINIVVDTEFVYEFF